MLPVRRGLVALSPLNENCTTVTEVNQRIRKAQCACGQATLEVKGEPELSGICHCDNCKRRTGSAFGWSAYFNNDQFTRSAGNFSEFDVDIDPPQKRFFCTRCGSTLFGKTQSLPHLIGIAGGIFVDDPLSAPDRSYQSESKIDWCPLPLSCSEV